MPHASNRYLMVRLPSKLARSLRPYEAVTSSSLEDSQHVVASREVIAADDNTLGRSKSHTSDDHVEVVGHGESSLFENESDAIEDLIERSKPNCICRRSSISSMNNDIELAVYSSKPSDEPATDDATEILSQDENSSWSSSHEDETDKIYNTFDDSMQMKIDPFSIGYIGIGASYFSVGLMLGASHSLMYPTLVVKGGSSSSFLAASHALIMIFWSYKIFFGFLSDCFPIFGLKRKPYMIIGWSLCLCVLVSLASDGREVAPTKLVILLSFANFGYVWADTTADGLMVAMAQREPIETRGKTQVFCYTMSHLGKIIIDTVVLLGMSGPESNCPGYKSHEEECTPDTDASRHNSAEWCHEVCQSATLGWDLPITYLSLGICFVILTSIPLYACLKEEKVEAQPTRLFIGQFWSQIQRRAVWQLILYGIISHITLGVHNAAKPNANFEWLGLSTFQTQIMKIFAQFAIFVSLNFIRRYLLNYSWRKMVLIGSCLVLIFNSLYFLIIFDILRSATFYIFTDVSSHFMFTLNSFVGSSSLIEVAEPGYEAVTFSLITTGNNLVKPLSDVISYQLLASFFPDLVEQSSIASDTPEVRRGFAKLQFLVMLLNLSSLLALPLLPTQKIDTQNLVARGEKSTFWGKYVMITIFCFLCYSTTITFITVADHDSLGCLKILGGKGCTDDESDVPAFCLVSLILAYCYGTNFYLAYWPHVRTQLWYRDS